MSYRTHCDYCGEPIESAHDHAAVHAIGWDDLGDYHRTPCLGFIKEAVEAACGSAVGRKGNIGQQLQQSDPLRRIREARARWNDLGKAGQERLVIEVLGDGRLTNREVAEAMQANLGECYTIHDSHARNVLRHLLAAGEVVRDPEQWRGRMRYRYSRKSPSGPIVDLERTFNEGGE